MLKKNPSPLTFLYNCRPKNLAALTVLKSRALPSVAFMQQTCGIYIKRPAKGLTVQVPSHKTYPVESCVFYDSQFL